MTQPHQAIVRRVARLSPGQSVWIKRPNYMTAVEHKRLIRSALGRGYTLESRPSATIVSREGY